MNQKPSPLAKLKRLTEEQADQLFEMLRIMPYYLGVKHCEEQWGVTTSVSGLRRWWKRESSKRMRMDFRSTLAASKKFDGKVDKTVEDERAANGIRAAFWNAVANRDIDSIETFAKLMLDYNADARDEKKMQRLLKAEKAMKDAQDQLAKQNEKIAALEKQLAEAGKQSIADPAAVAEELDRHLGVKK